MAPGTTTLVVMGVSGSGKSTVAAELVRLTGWPFAEGDDLHPAANVAAMRAGRALTDADRWPWLDRVAAWIGDQERGGRDAVVTCSALRRCYRDVLREGHPSVRFVHVTVSPERIDHRLAARTGHFMPPSLLGSQFATLEPLGPDEPGVVVSNQGPPRQVAAHVLARVA